MSNAQIKTRQAQELQQQQQKQQQDMMRRNAEQQRQQQQQLMNPEIIQFNSFDGLLAFVQAKYGVDFGIIDKNRSSVYAELKEHNIDVNSTDKDNLDKVVGIAEILKSTGWSFQQYHNFVKNTPPKNKSGFTTIEGATTNKLNVVSNLGCFKNNAGVLPNSKAGFQGDLSQRMDDCHKFAKQNGDDLFALVGGGQCRTGNSNRVLSQAKQFSANDCPSHGLGGPSSYQLYQLISTELTDQNAINCIQTRPGVAARIGTTADSKQSNQKIEDAKEVCGFTNMNTNSFVGFDWRQSFTQREGLETMPFTSYTGYRDTNFSGATTWNQVDGSNGQENCKQICDNDPNCGVFSVGRRQGLWDCWTSPKASYPYVPSGGGPDFVSYTKDTQPETIAVANGEISYKQFKDTDSAGNDILPIEVDSIDSCKIECNNRSDCYGIVYDHRGNTKRCWLKNSNYGNAPLNFLKDVDFYIKTPAPRPTGIPYVSAPTPNAGANPSNTDIMSYFYNKTFETFGVRENAENMGKIKNMEKYFQVVKDNGININDTNDLVIMMNSITSMKITRVDELQTILNNIGSKIARTETPRKNMTTMYVATLYGVDKNNYLEFFKLLNNMGIATASDFQKFDDSITNGKLRKIGATQSVPILETLNDFGLKYNEIDPFVDALLAVGINEKTDLNAFFSSVKSFGLNASNLPKFQTLTNMKNLDKDLSEYVKNMQSFGISKYDATHQELLRIIQRMNGSVPNDPENILKQIENIKTFGIKNMQEFVAFTDKMKKHFKYDVGDISGMINDKNGIYRKFKNKDDIPMNVEDVHHTIHILKNANIQLNRSGTFEDTVSNAYAKNIRLYSQNENQRLRKNMNALSGDIRATSLYNVSGFTTIREGMENDRIYSISNEFGISDFVNAVKYNDSYKPMVQFTADLNSFGIDTPAKFQKMVRVFTQFEANKDDFYEIIEILNNIGVDNKSYVKFIEQLVQLKLFYGDFKNFISSIKKIKVRYSTFDLFIKTCKSYQLSFENNMRKKIFYMFIDDMAKRNLMMEIEQYSKSCKKVVQKNTSQYVFADVPNSTNYSFVNAVKNFIMMGFNSYTHQPVEGVVFKTPQIYLSSLLDKIQKLDNELGDIRRLNEEILNCLPNKPPENQLYIRDHIVLFLNEKNLVINPLYVCSFTPNNRFEEMKDARQRGPGADFYCSLSEQIVVWNKKTNDLPGLEAKYNAYNITANTCRIFPNYVAKFMKKYATTDSSLSSKQVDQNPNLQRNCQKYINIPIPAGQCANNSYN